MTTRHNLITSSFELSNHIKTYLPTVEDLYESLKVFNSPHRDEILYHLDFVLESLEDVLAALELVEQIKDTLDEVDELLF